MKKIYKENYWKENDENKKYFERLRVHLVILA
jgi:hypothetical protein